MLEKIADFFLFLYNSHALDVLIIQFLNIFLIALLVNRLLLFALRAQGKSLAVTLRYLAYAFITFAGTVVIWLVSPLPGIRWDLLFVFSESVFIVSVFYAVNHLKESMTAYEYLIKKKEKDLTKGKI